MGCQYSWRDLINFVVNIITLLAMVAMYQDIKSILHDKEDRDDHKW